MKRGQQCAMAMACMVIAWGVTTGYGATGEESPAATAASVAMQKGLDYIKSLQRENGSWGDENYPAMTALGLWAFARSQHPDRSNICVRAAAFVAGFAQDDGGIYKKPTGGRGSGGLSTYNTAICMTALHLYDGQHFAPMLLKAREFVAKSQLQGDSTGAGGFGYDQKPPAPPDKDTLLRMMAERAKAEGKPAPSPDDVEKMMKAHGGRGGPRGGGMARADLSNTGWALMAMRVTQSLEDLRPAGDARVDLDWVAATNFVAKLQNQDQTDPEHYGGFGYETRGERGGTFTDSRDGTVKLRGYGSMTYAGVESMIYAQVSRQDPRVVSAIQWAARHWSVDENPGMGAKGLYYYYNIMSKALVLSRSDTIATGDGKAIAWKDQLLSKLVSAQKKDGSWQNEDNQYWENNPMLVTSYVVLTIENCLSTR